MMENQNPSAEVQQQEIAAVETIQAQQEQTAEQRTYDNTADIIIRVKEMAQDPLNTSNSRFLSYACRQERGLSLFSYLGS